MITIAFLVVAVTGSWWALGLARKAQRREELASLHRAETIDHEIDMVLHHGHIYHA